MVKGINIKIVYPTANKKHTGFMARTLQLALLEEAESLTNIKSLALDTRNGVLQKLLESQGCGALIDGGDQRL